eukprot:NODE_10061_length_1379_cov_6.650958.p1 GENE.NODE_10061_length_1379_cov_6.650958~~NODE_10061_length_1379_cov_6.650958.p1  ORF type:complete len:307 (-),score=84.25 NODE_10061_length_1379_cov_6.650958:383-1303(-)
MAAARLFRCRALVASPAGLTPTHQTHAVRAIAAAASLRFSRTALPRALPLATRQPAVLLAARHLAIRRLTRPQELHRHRKRLDGFAKGAPRGDAGVLAACQDLLRDEDWYARKVAIDAIAGVAKPHDEQQLALLYKHLSDDDIFVREAAVDAVGMLAQRFDNVAVTEIAMRLVDEDCFVRARAVFALGQLGRPGDPDMLGLLEEMFDDGFVPVRKRAIEAAVCLAGENIAPFFERLKRCLQDRDPEVRRQAKGALDELSRRQHVQQEPQEQLQLQQQRQNPQHQQQPHDPQHQHQPRNPNQSPQPR